MAGSADEFLDALDHPIFFLVVVTIGVLAMAAILTYIAKRYNLPGLAALAQTP